MYSIHTICMYVLYSLGHLRASNRIVLLYVTGFYLRGQGETLSILFSRYIDLVYIDLYNSH
jgi:hypothetical protein